MAQRLVPSQAVRGVGAPLACVGRPWWHSWAAAWRQPVLPYHQVGMWWWLVLAPWQVLVETPAESSHGWQAHHERDPGQ